MKHRHVCFAEPGGPVERITDQAVAAAERHFRRRLAAARAVIAAVEDISSIEDRQALAAAALLELGASWTPNALAALLGEAMELAALEGREAAFLDGETRAFAEPDFTRQEFREQIEFLAQKRPQPTRAWTDAMYGTHDRAFVVAGATDIAMLEEFQAAIVQGARTYDAQGFAAEFDRIVEKYGWSYNGGRSWRIRTIFEVNIRSSYMAGRLRQMRDPDMVKLRPYWIYRHADTRVPENPRPEHVAFDGLVLMWNDPWWDVYFPPNGWLCSCGCHSLSRGDLRRLGKTGPDTAPEIVRHLHTDEPSGQAVMLPEGVDFGWDYMPGDHWQRGLVPSELVPVPQSGQDRHVAVIDAAEPITDLRAKAQPFKAQRLPDGLPPDDYVAAFLAEFEQHPDYAAPFFTDRAGGRILISDDIFRDRQGVLKIHAGDRGPLAPLIAEAIIDPDEIWLGVRSRSLPDYSDYEELLVTRRYIRVDPETGLFAAFDLGRKFWTGVTGFRPSKDYNPAKRVKTNWSYLNHERVGKLLWKRK